MASFTLAANLSMMYGEVPLEQRFAAAAADGFKAVELLWPYEFSVHRFQQLLQEHDLQLALINTSGGDTAAGQWGRAALPDESSKQQARADIEQALEYAAAVGGKRVHVMASVLPQERKAMSAAELAPYREAFIENLVFACKQAQNVGITITVEALCPEIKPHYFYHSQFDSLEIVKAVQASGCSNIKQQYDFFHAQMVDGAISKYLRQHISDIGHIQIAAVPDRSECDHGEIDYRYCFALLQELQYTGFIGCEYKPRGNTSAGLDFLRPYL